MSWKDNHENSIHPKRDRCSEGTQRAIVIAFVEYVGDLANHYAAGIMTIIPAVTMWIKGHEGIIEEGIQNFEDVIVEINDEKERSKDA